MQTLISFGMIFLFVTAGAANAATTSVAMIFEKLDWSGVFV
jgi:hypothetical protein